MKWNGSKDSDLLNLAWQLGFRSILAISIRIFVISKNFSKIACFGADFICEETSPTSRADKIIAAGQAVFENTKSRRRTSAIYEGDARLNAG